MSTPNNVAIGNIISVGLSDTLCFTDAADLIKQLTSILKAEIPLSGITNLVVSNTQPTDSQTTSLWLRLSNSGGVIGFYVFAGGKWVPFYPVNNTHVTQINWFYSDDGSVPEGWEKITNTTSGIQADVRTALTAQYIQDGTHTFDVFYAARYIGT